MNALPTPIKTPLALQWLEASDDAQDWFRAVHLSAATAHIHAVLLAVVFVAPTQDELPSPDWLARQLRPDDDQTNVHASRDADASPDADANTDTVVDRIAWLMGGQHAARVDNGNTVCACFAVGERTILAAIAEAQQAGQPCSTADLGARLRCGTNCGSCLPELRRMIARAHD